MFLKSNGAMGNNYSVFKEDAEPVMPKKPQPQGLNIPSRYPQYQEFFSITKVKLNEQ